MDAVETPARNSRAHARRTAVRAAVLFAPLACVLTLCAVVAYAKQPAVPNAAKASVLPAGGAGLRETKSPDWSTDPADPYPMPPQLANVELMKQTHEEAYAKSVGCIGCHKGIGDPHGKDTLRIGCTDCHGGDATACDEGTRPTCCPRFPQFWPTSANPVRSYTLLNHESPEFIRFVNPGDLRIAHISCGTAGCHPKEVQTNRKQMMTTGCMLWGAALYNNGSVPVQAGPLRRSLQHERRAAAPQDVPPPTQEEMDKKGVVAVPRPAAAVRDEPAGQRPPHLRARRPLPARDRHPRAARRTRPAAHARSASAASAPRTAPTRCSSA